MPRVDYKREADTVVVTHDHAALTATTAIKLYKVPAGRTLRLDRVSYVNPTGLAFDAANNFAGTVQKGATVAATVFATGTAVLTADTFVDGVLSATEANRVFLAGEIVSFVATETGIQTLPVGHLVLEGRLF